MTSFLDRWETELDRTEFSIDLVTLEGDLVFSFPPDWTSAMVWKALEFGNLTWRKGYACGEAQAKHAMRQALGI